MPVNGMRSIQESLDGLTSSTSATLVVPTRITKTVTSAGTPEALAADGTVFRKAVIIVKKAARTANSGLVYLGVTSTNDAQPIELNPGDIWTIEALQGEKYDLNDWYLDVTVNGDGVVIIYS